jgi:PAS domain S-box-containing protein
MNKTTRILLVDDDPVGRDFFAGVLRKEGYEVWEASTGQMGLEAVRNRRPDLVLLDLVLPDLGAAEIIRAIKTDSALGDVFVVLFSGHTPDAARTIYGPEVTGDDYIVKTPKRDEFLARVQTAAQLRDTTMALRASQAHYTQLAEHIREVFWVTDPAKREMIYVSPAYAEIWGRSAESLHASPMDWLDAIHPEDRGRVREAAFTKQISGEYNEVYRIVRPDGSVRWIQDRAFPIRNGSGEVYRVVGIADDITERKEAEAELTMLAHGVESTSEPICITDLQDRFTFVNRAFEETYGYTKEEILGKTPEILLSPRNPRSVLADILKKTREGGWRGEVWDQHRDGTELPVFLSTSQVKDQTGRVIAYMGVAQNMADRKRAERQIRLLADAVQSTHEIVYLTNPENRITFVNQAFLGIYGYKTEEVLDRRPDFLYSPNNPPGFCEQVFRQTLAGGWRGEVLNCRKNGTEFPISLSTSQIKDSEGRVVGFIGVARDIRERRRAEKHRAALAQLGNRLGAAATTEEAADSILEIASELFGWDTSYLDLYSEADQRIIPIMTIDTMNGDRRRIPLAQLSLEPTPMMRLVMTRGAVLLDRDDESSPPVNLVPFGDVGRPSASRMYVPIHSDGKVLGVLSIQSYTPRAYSQQDLGLLEALADLFGNALQRIKVTDALREAESKYRTIVENATEGIFQTTPEGRYRSANLALARMLGYQSPEDLISNITDIERQTFVAPERRQELKQFLEARGSVQGFEAERYRKDGTRIWTSINSHVIRDARGAILYYEGTNQDITERKRSEHRLADALELNLTILSASSTGILAYRESGQCIFANGAAARIVGASPEQLLRQNFREIASWQESGLLEVAEETLRTRQMQARRVHMVTTFGKDVWIECQAASFVSAGELHLLMLNNEITARQQAEAALEQSRRRQTAILDTIPDPAWLKDVEGRFLACNEALTRFYDLTPEQIIGKTALDLALPDADQLVAEDNQVMQSRKPALFEAARRDAQGHSVWFESFNSPIFNESGEVTGTVGIAREVTERKRTEQELRDLSQRVIEAQEAERLRVARELHDGVNQLIASAKMRLRKVEDVVSGANPAAREILRRCEQLLVRALEENRRIAHNLRPSDLDELGLAAACRNFCKELQSRTKLTLKCRIAKFSERLLPTIELNLFRIVQEALTNVEAHAHAKNARLSIYAESDFFVLKIQDDGRGFTPASASRGKKDKRGLGFTNMRERAAAVGGICQVETAPGRGTTITVRIPSRHANKKATR